MYLLTNCRDVLRTSSPASDIIPSPRGRAQHVPTIALLFALIAMQGCISELVQPTFFGVTAPTGATPIPDSGRARLGGVYAVTSGNETFGDTLIALWRDDHFCLYSGSEVIFFETAGRMQADSSALFDGYYRFVRSEVSGH